MFLCSQDKSGSGLKSHSKHLTRYKKYLDEDNEAFIRSIQNEMEEKEKVEIERQRVRLIDNKSRIQELERLMCRIYEDMILEKIPSSRYRYLIANMKQSKEL